jgi:recA bacterial DNA recombination protein
MANMAGRPLSEFLPRSGDAKAFDLTQGLAALPRGCISEILGGSSSGRTAVAQAMLSTATLGGEVCAWVDCADAFDPVTARAAGTDLGKLLWVQCGQRLEVALKSADMILHNGGFGLIVLDLCDASVSGLQRVPLSYWYRLRNAVQHTPAVLLVLGRESIAKSCAVRQFALDAARVEWRGLPPFQIVAKFKLWQHRVNR